MPRLLVPIVVALVAAPDAAASITVASNAARPALRVDARGFAEVSWTANGLRRTLLVPPRGRLLPGGRLSGRDVSRPTTAVAIPFRRVLRRTADGRLWALQAWRVQPGGAVELHFSRWMGAPTRVEASIPPTAGPIERIIGSATFQGRRVYGFSSTPEGKRIRHYAWIDCFACGGASGWRRLLGVRLEAPGGTFSALLRGDWQSGRYRVTVAGPNRGATLAPDAAVIVTRTGQPPLAAIFGPGR